MINIKKNMIRSKRKGYSLIELMFGVAILLIPITVSLLSFVNCILLNESSRNIVTAANDAQYALEQIKAQKNFANIQNFILGYPATTFTNLINERITFPNPVYTSTLDTIAVQISWNERNVTKTFSITARFAQ